MTPRKRRAVVLNSLGMATDALASAVDELSCRHDEVVVAIEGTNLLERWMRVRCLLAGRQHIHATPLVPCAALASLEDRCAALVARLGDIDTLLVESPAWLACAGKLALEARYVDGLSTTALTSAAWPACTRALVVTRAQPFHRGHLALIEHALACSQEVVVVIAAAERSHTERDPFTAGERLALVQSSLEHVASRVWLAALPSPAWPAMALSQLAFLTPSFERVVAHNPILRAMSRQAGKIVDGLPAPVEAHGQAVSSTRIRARLGLEGAGAWLDDYVPRATAELLRTSAWLSDRCALIARAGG